MSRYIRAGFSRIDITPPLDRIDAHGIGYWYQRSVRFTGVRDPLFVRTLAIGEGTERQLLIAVDSIFDSFGFGPAAAARIASALGIKESHIFLTCTHTHSSPLIDRNNTWCGIEYGPFVAECIARSAFEADGNKVHTEVSVCVGHVPDVLYNRRPLLANGRIAELHIPLSPEAVVDSGPLDDTMTIVKFLHHGRMVGGLCHFGIHGVGLQCSPLISGDYLGRAIQIFEAETGNDVVLLHLNAPCADIDPLLMGEESLDIMTSRLHVGVRTVTNAAEQPLDELLPLQAFHFTFRARRRPARSVELLDAAQQRLHQSTEESHDSHHHSGAGYESFLLAEERKVSALPGEFDILYQILRWGNLFFVGIAGEIFTRFGLALRAACPQFSILPVGLTCGAAGYLPAAEMFQQGGYEVACAQWCPIAPGESEKLFAQITADLQSIAGPAPA